MVAITHYSCAIVTAILLLIGGSVTAHAQSRATVLEEVIVTAEKREASLQDAPISIKAFDNGALEQLGVDGIDDLTGKVPNLSFSPFPADATALRVFIRGIGVSDVQITQDPGVAVYLDGVYIARSTGLALDVADIASLEVLRGPQGTLFGRNTIGGAINIKTAPPDMELLTIKQEFTAGSRQLFSSRTTANLPLTGRFAAKATYLNDRQDGYVNNIGEGKDFYDTQDEALRIALRWEASDSMTVDYAYENGQSKYVSPVPQAVGEPLVTDPIFGLDALAPLNPDTIQIRPEERASSLPSIVRQEPSVNDIEGHTLTLAWEVGDSELKSITSYRELKSDSFIDLSRSAGILPNGEFFRLAYPALDINIGGTNVFGISGPQTLPSHPITIDQDQFTQEFQWLGSVNEQLVYILGLYYFTESADEARPRSGITAFFNANLAGSDFARTDVIREEMRSIDNEALAAYSQFRYTPAIWENRFSATVGLRFTRDKREATNRVVQDTFLSNGTGGTAQSIVARNLTAAAPTGIILVDGQGKESFSNVSYDFTLGYEFSETVNAYVKVANGYKAGGFNTREIVEELFVQGFDEETVMSYEVGVKSELLERRVRLNAAVFFSDYDDIQLNLAIPPGQSVGQLELPSGTFDITANVTDTNTINAGTAEVSGIEIDLTAVPIEGLVLSASYAYLDTEFTKIDDPRPFADPDAEFQFISAPTHTYNLNALYTFAPFTFGTLSASMNYSYVDDRDANYEGNFRENAAVPDFALLDARLELADIPAWNTGNFKIALWGKNLTDKEYLLDAVATIPGSDRTVWFGEPRSLGVDLMYQFER